MNVMTFTRKLQYCIVWLHCWVAVLLWVFFCLVCQPAWKKIRGASILLLIQSNLDYPNSRCRDNAGSKYTLTTWPDCAYAVNLCCVVATREPAAALLSNLVLMLKVKETQVFYQSRMRLKCLISLSYISFCMHDDFVGVAWAWTMLSEFFAHPNGSKFPLGQRGLDSRGWTVTPKLQKDHSNDLKKLIRML